MNAWEENIALGFDGGGTKTDCVVLDFEGKVVGRGAAGPSNPLHAGFDVAFQQLAHAAAHALAGAQVRPRHVHSVCAGLAGGAQREVVRRTLGFLAREFPTAFAHVTTDFEVALEAAVGAGPGVVLIAGTGSCAFGRNAAGETARAGGFGYAIGDEGSAYEIGRRGVAELGRARDLGMPAATLADRIFAAVDGLAWEQLVAGATQSPVDIFPRLFPAVAAAAEAQDNVAREILRSAALQLSALALTVVRQLGFEEKEFTLAKHGGVFGVSVLLDSAVDAALLTGAPQARISRLETPAAVGAARLGARLTVGGNSATRVASGAGGGGGGGGGES